MTTTLRITLFGKLQVWRGDRPVSELNGRKHQELLSYLLLYPDRPHSRETLADLLWGENDALQARNYLRKALWQLQTSLEADSTPGPGVLFLAEPEWVQVNPQADFWLDTAVFVRSFAQVHGVAGEALDAVAAGSLRNAVALYQAELLVGWTQSWCLYEREHYQYIYLAMLDKLIDYCLAHGEYESGLGYGTRLLAHDRARERTHRQLMHLYALAGDRTAALRQYRICAAALREELGAAESGNRCPLSSDTHRPTG